MNKVELIFNGEAECEIRKKLYGVRQREDCAEGDGAIPSFTVEIPESNIVNGYVEGFRGKVSIKIFIGGNSKSFQVSPNGAMVVASSGDNFQQVLARA